MLESYGYAATKSNKKLRPVRFEREDLRPHDVAITIQYCGVCHSDLHQVKNDWGNTVYPCLPGHEIVGVVEDFGAEVKGFKKGDLVGVGCMIGSCGTCVSCKEGLEQYCEKGFLGTYNGPLEPDGRNTFGGYSSNIVVHEHFVLKVPKGLKPEFVGPILCAGVTTYSPLKNWGVGEGDMVAVVGFGGLGHMAVQIARAMGAEVTVISTTEDKQDDALELGADAFVLSTKKKSMEELKGQFDLIINTIPDKHEVDPYLELLARDGSMVMVGVLVPEPGWNQQPMILKRRSISGSLIGSIEETQEVLDFCAEHGIRPKIEIIDISDINSVFKRMEKREIHYRAVIDMKTLATQKSSQLKDLGTIGH